MASPTTTALIRITLFEAFFPAFIPAFFLALRPSVLPALLACTLLLPATGVLAQVYKVTDGENGVTFTDRPPDSSTGTVEKINIREPNTTAATPPQPASQMQRDESQAGAGRGEEEAPSASVRISSPADESTIAMGPGNFTVSARVDPPLGSAEQLVLMVDGQALGAEQSSTSWFIEGALRGPHDLVVRRLNAAGETVATSEPVRVYVLRPSVIGR